MYSRWFNIAVVLLWLATMSWLVVKKVLPSLLIGQPPSYRTIIAAGRDEPPVGWRMSMGGRQLGWALSRTVPLPHEMTEIRSQVHFDELPLAEMTPDWLRSLLQLDNQPWAKFAMDTESVLVIDPLDRLSRFRSAVRFDALRDAIVVDGTVEGAEMAVSFRSGEVTYNTNVPVPAKALMADSFSPQTSLPGLRAGQTWTVPTYSPLRPPNDPVEILQATVEGTELVTWNDRSAPTWLVVYRSDPGAGLGNADNLRGKLWVRRDGAVLKQTVTFLGSTMTFIRLPEDEAAELAETAGSLKK